VARQGGQVSDPADDLVVDCYAGHRGEETPVRFRLGSEALEIERVLDRWLAPDHRYFKVLAAGGVYILRHDVVSGRWALTAFDRHPPRDAGPSGVRS
jgi:hypothetical protein